ncbi:DUF2271 domain-containing protein [Devosia sp.]|uniref:DUF2271 domain-containing protein n=1 Tax=Devosia sp. TaxID=1871048 RepID=UPI002F09FF2E
MHKLAAALMLATAIVAPEIALARDITVTAQMARYNGPGAYLAIYVTDAAGAYHSTLWVAGGKVKYYRHLRDWVRGIAAAGGSIDGITGASVGSGQTLTVKANIADALIDAGYQIRVDSAVEEAGEYAAEIVVPLEQQQSGVPVSGPGYVDNLTVSM